LLPITSEDLKAEAGEQSCDDGKATLAALLGFIVNSQSAEAQEGGEERIGRGSITQDGALCHEETTKRRVRLKELRSINSKNVDASCFRDTVGETPGILRPNTLMCVSEEVGDVGSGSGKWQVGICGENGA